MDKKTVFVGHPIAGDVSGNVGKVVAICKEIHTKDIIPVAPYLGLLQYLDDEVVEDRELGFDANLEYFRRGFIDELWLYGDRISSGMKEEVDLALELGIPTILKTESVMRDFIKDFIKESARKGLVMAKMPYITVEHVRAAKVDLTLSEWMVRGKELTILHEENQANQKSSHKGMSEKDITIFLDYSTWSDGGIMA